MKQYDTVLFEMILVLIPLNPLTVSNLCIHTHTCTHERMHTCTSSSFIFVKRRYLLTRFNCILDRILGMCMEVAGLTLFGLVMPVFTLFFVVVFSVKIRVMPMTPELKSIHGTMDVYIYVSTGPVRLFLYLSAEITKK